MAQLSSTRTRRGSIGLDGAESYYCDLSGRGLATAQIERTLRVFETAEAIDLSNNEIERIPSTIPHSILALDISFNLIASADGIDRLKNLQELHLGFNRLVDVSILEFCPRLQRVNLSGNRLMNTKGLETLVLLEHLDLSENLIEFPETLRPLSLNRNLTHLTLRGNPIGLNPKTDYRVLLLDMIPSVLVLDDKKIRSAVKYKGGDNSSNSAAASSKSLSYSRLYDDKKQFVIRHQNRPYPAKKVKPLIAGDTSSRYDGSMFLQPAVEPSHERVRSLQLQESRSERSAAPLPAPASLVGSHQSPPPPAPSHLTASVSGAKVLAAAPYMSLYDRLAQANGMQQLTKSAIPPSKPIEARPNPSTSSPPATAPADRPRRQAAAPMATGRPQAPLMSPAKSTLRSSVHRPAAAAAPVRSIPPATASDTSSKRPSAPAADPKVSASVRAKQQPGVPTTRSSAPGPRLDEKQRNILSVIQNLIQHKKQTLATLARASPVAT